MKPQGIDRLGFLIHDVARLLRRRFEARSGEVSLSAAQWRLLFRVAKDEGLPQARLAELLEIEPISVSRMVDRMVEAGWVERRAGAGDRRVRTVHPTQRARAVYETVLGMADEVYAEALAGIEPERRADLIAMLERMTENLAECGRGSEAKGEDGAARPGLNTEASRR